MIEKYIFGPLKHGLLGGFKRADLEIFGIDTFRPSYSGLVFFNDNDVDENNCGEERPSCAGRFSVFGHSECVGDDNHCDVPTSRRRFDDRPSHPLTPAFRRVVVTEALRRAIEQQESVTITIVVGSSAEKYEGDRLFVCRGLQLVTFV